MRFLKTLELKKGLNTISKSRAIKSIAIAYQRFEYNTLVFVSFDNFFIWIITLSF